ncbi:MAG TPA: MBL fold metallo-hydrolase [Gammaproteobacteria bacterium]
MTDAVADSLDYPLPGLPEPGGALEVAPGLFWLRMPLPFALDHINLWLLRDGDGWTVVDTGYALEQTCALWEQLLAEVVAPAPVRRIIVTHFHPDHVGLAAWLAERCAAPVWMTAGEFLMAQWVFNDGGIGDFPIQDRFFRSHGLPPARLAPLTSRGNPYRRGVPALPHHYRRLQEGDRVRIGERSWQVITGFGHSPEHAALYCAEERLLISGDQVLPKITTNIGVWHTEPEDDPLGRYLRSLRRYEPLAADTLVLPSHGRVFRGLHARLAALHRHHEQRLDEVLAACSAPLTAADLLGVLFRRELDLHQLRFAMGEAIAHLHHLWHAGRLLREVAADGVHRFHRA